MYKITITFYFITKQKDYENKNDQYLFSGIFAGYSYGRASGQMGDIGKFTAGGVDDAEKLMKAYLTPWANALGTSLSGGWYNTAKVHKPLGFDLTFTLNMGFVPSSDKTFNLTELGLSTSDFSANTAPTAAGKKETGPEIRYADGLLHLQHAKRDQSKFYSFSNDTGRDRYRQRNRN